MISPKGRAVDIPVEDGYVGMVDREVFDEWLRHRAVSAGAERRTGIFIASRRDADGTVDGRPIATAGRGPAARRRCGPAW